jgi:hypothetical protein
MAAISDFKTMASKGAEGLLYMGVGLGVALAVPYVTNSSYFSLAGAVPLATGCYAGARGFAMFNNEALSPGLEKVGNLLVNARNWWQAIASNRILWLPQEQ